MENNITDLNCGSQQVKSFCINRDNLYDTDMDDLANLDTLAKRCIWARERLGLSQKDVAKEVGMEQQSYSSIETGETLSPRQIVKIADFLQVKPGWLLFGEGTPYLHKIPSISWSDVVKWQTWTEAARDTIKEIVPMDTDKYKDCYSLTIKNDLMVSNDPKDKSFAPGDIVIVNPGIEPENGDFVVAHEQGAPEAMLKKYAVDGVERRLYSNKKESRVIVVDDSIKFYGVVVAKRPPLEVIKEL